MSFRDNSTNSNIGHRNRISMVAFATMLIAFSILSMLAGCQKKTKTEMTNTFSDRKTMPVLHSKDVSTLISDSGITRYKVDAKEWFIFDKASEPYWYFPEGIYVEKFDSLLKIEATIKADTAYFYEYKKLWKLVGNVNIMNIQEEHFSTPLLFWDQYKRKIYSDSFISIRQPKRIIFGVGFESNEQMNDYIIRNVKGTFLVDEEEE